MKFHIFSDDLAKFILGVDDKLIWLKDFFLLPWNMLADLFI